VLEDLRLALIAQGIEPARSGGWARRRISETRRILSPVRPEFSQPLLTQSSISQPAAP
jgi:hypothetical protein